MILVISHNDELVSGFEYLSFKYCENCVSDINALMISICDIIYQHNYPMIFRINIKFIYKFWCFIIFLHHKYHMIKGTSFYFFILNVLVLKD